MSLSPLVPPPLSLEDAGEGMYPLPERGLGRRVSAGEGESGERFPEGKPIGSGSVSTWTDGKKSWGRFLTQKDFHWRRTEIPGRARSDKIRDGLRGDGTSDKREKLTARNELAQRF